jgi:hypothetical protein
MANPHQFRVPAGSRTVVSGCTQELTFRTGPCEGDVLLTTARQTIP